MSKIIWSNNCLAPKDLNIHTLQSAYYPKMEALQNCLSIPSTDRDIKIAEPRAFRSMSRAALLLSSTCQPCQGVIQKYLNEDPFSVGIYAALENGPIHLETTAKMADLRDGEFSNVYKKLRNPKMYLKQLPNLAPAQMGIFLKIQGPLNVYTHSTAASIQALEQAEFDLNESKVKAALVCGVFSFEDPLINARTRKKDETQRCLSEAAAALVLVKDDTYSDWQKSSKTDTQYYYGIADEIVNITKERESNDN